MGLVKMTCLAVAKERSLLVHTPGSTSKHFKERLYWQLEGTLAGQGRIEYLWKNQEGRCRGCGQTLRPSDKPWHIHHRRWRCHGGQDTVDNLELLHKQCHHQIHYGQQS